MISHNDGTREIWLDELIACQILMELVGTIRNGNQLDPVLKD
jgi:hypothetical protein